MYRSKNGSFLIPCRHRNSILRVMEMGYQISNMTTILPQDFYNACLAHYAAVKDEPHVVDDAMPVPFFGDIRAYQASPIRVMTAAINPSDKEFPVKGQQRFDTGFAMTGPDAFEAALSDYFRVNPYTKWFSAFEKVLNGMDASFGGKIANINHRNTALHIDFCSPIATNPTWTTLSAVAKAKLEQSGKLICAKLIDLLRPNVVIASMGASKMRQFGSEHAINQSWDVLQTYKEKENGLPFRSSIFLRAKSMQTASGHQFIMAYGSGGILPFGNFSTARKLQAGRSILLAIQGS